MAAEADVWLWSCTGREERQFGVRFTNASSKGTHTMSRIPQSSSSRPTAKQTPSKPTLGTPSRSLVPPSSKSRATSPSLSPTSPSPRIRVKSAVSSPVAARARVDSTASPRTRVNSSLGPRQAAKSPVRKTTKPPSPADAEPLPSTSKPALSIREAIALKRAEAKKAQAPKSTFDELGEVDANFRPMQKQEEDDFDLGRPSVRETIDRSRSSGQINLSTRALKCLPSALFEVHLGVTPDPLPSLLEEPSLPESTARPKYKNGGEVPAWYEAQDLQVLKAWSNEIVEIQHEISLFGSLQTVDLHNNRLTSLPDTFADLTELVYLDLSQNSLTSLPSNIFALPNLIHLNVAHNSLTSFPLRSPFTPEAQAKSRQNRSSGFFEPTVSRAQAPLPKLQTLDASHNDIPATAIDHDPGDLPPSLIRLDLSVNPLETGTAACVSLLRATGQLPKLRELRLEKAIISDRSFPSDLLADLASPFPALRLLDCGESHATLTAVHAALSPLSKQLSFDYTTEDPPEGTLRVLVGKKVVKEAWEIEAERRAKVRGGRRVVEDGPEGPFGRADTPVKDVVKEAWEIEAEQGLLTEGAKRRARAAATMQAQIPRAAPSAAAKPPALASPPLQTLSLSNPQFYNERTQALTLPPSKPPSKAKAAPHARAFSLVIPAWNGDADAVDRVELALPTPTVPLAEIAVEPLAQTLRVLVLANRRMDPVVRLPTSDGIFLPYLEELSLEGCGFGDSVPVFRADANGGVSPSGRTSEQLLPLLSKLFPSLQTLDLSDNVVTSEALTDETLSGLILTSATRKGLRHLRLRGNRLDSLDGFAAIAEHFKGNRDFPEWKLEELDLRDNSIGKLPPELGLLPLDVFLVDGNVFRVPQRRIWEREGTKGLLSWLRGRIE
ncbi:L domain-like protein [Neolentinus lepideus HHB14362 ss-1]|uniref:L domain-like protein n=1 Tax=Neolentinus lepideus HHB14362 ss-1 TaxID=1314782 RepID=A0A165QZD7_9AGAM|nr:L domain-like protein [Neolentinus lepideus HHB14362 ss-1]